MTRALLLAMAVAAMGCKAWKKKPAPDAGVVVVDAAAATSAAKPDAATPVYYTSKTAGFRVSFPSGKTPDVEEKTIASGGSAVRIYKVQYGTSAYLVTHDDFAKESGRPAADVLRGAREGIVETTGGTVEQEKAITLGPHPGIDLVITATTSGIKMRQHLRAYFVDGRHYQMLVVAPDWSGAPGVEQEFLDSFGLL